MASLMFADCSSSTTSRIIHPNIRNGSFLPRRCIDQLRLQTTTSGRGCALSIRSSSSPTPVVSTLIDGSAVAKPIRDEIRIQVSRMKETIGVVPGLAVILVGDMKDSARYVRNKKKACESVGIKSLVVRLPEDSSEKDVLKSVSGFNDDPFCPWNPCSAASTIGKQKKKSLYLYHMDEQNILNAVRIEKDVDGFHPLNMGQLAMREREPLFIPCTPKGCIELLHSYNVEIRGKRAVVLGRSNIVGMPAALLLQREDATVSIIHSKTKNPEEITRQADIIIAAVGQPNMVRGSWIKPGAVVLDVGTTDVDDPDSRSGYRLVGDVCYEEACKVASAVSPVPGGVGPMTIAMLLSNTLTSAKRIHNFH
ncbi:hypothetical protein EUTSA_v10029292mg [Eutrema salsugineum]|uniref:Uncharacterized protein n=1 Tax=Eutrema salsugineum TaxID=72664 RepID=V4LD59_EUTSA|nr:hypothetical protein EUTSA_v10029292mg [Eutrema salsugineum]